MSSAPEHEPRSTRFTALDALGVAINALLHAQDATASRRERAPRCVMDGLPAVTAAYLTFCSGPERELPSASLLLDKQLPTNSAPVPFYTDKDNVDVDLLFRDMVSAAVGHDQDTHAYAFHRYQLEIPPDGAHDDTAMFLVYISPSSSDDLAHAQWHTFEGAPLCADGRHAHILHLSDELAHVKRSLGIRSVAYSTTHPTAVAFHALVYIAMSSSSTLDKVPEKIFNLGYLVRVIFALERESVAGHFLSPEPWYHCLSLCGLNLHAVRDKVANFSWYALGRKMAVYDSRLGPRLSSGSGPSFEEISEQYTNALQKLAELFKRTADFFLSREAIPTSDVHHFPFLDQRDLVSSSGRRHAPGSSPLHHRVPLPTSPERTSPAAATGSPPTAYHPVRKG
ncbi:hypothetical protein JCM9279_007214 [Rhodotorula babjevae]